MRNKRVASERGFALPVTVFLVTLLTVMLASAFTRSASDRMVAGSSEAGVDALAIAQSGLQSYFGLVHPEAPTHLVDSMRFNFEGGYAWVVPQVLKVPSTPGEDIRYVVRSTAHVLIPALGSTPIATRHIAQFADWQTAAIDAPPAALISANDVDIDADGSSAGTVVFSGVDLAETATCPGITPTDGYGGRIASGTHNELDNATWIGSPARQTANSSYDVATLTDIDWTAIDGDQFDPDYTTLVATLSDFPTILLDGDYTVSTSSVDGQGLLMVTGRLSIPSSVSSWRWRGIVLVGRHLYIRSANVRFEGTVMTGLDYLWASSIPDSEYGNDNASQVIRFDYNSCAIRQTLESLSGFIVHNNAWVDNWTY